MEINLNDTVIPVNYLQLLNTKNIDWDEKDTQVVYDIVFTTMVNVLVSNKTLLNFLKVLSVGWFPSVIGPGVEDELTWLSE